MRGIRYTTDDPFNRAKIAIYENDKIPLMHVSQMLGQTQERIKEKLCENHDQFIIDNDQCKYPARTGKGYKYLVTRHGLFIFLTRFMNWTNEETEDAVNDIFDSEDDSIPLKKRDRPVDEVMLKEFLREADARIGANAIYAYRMSKDFQEDVARVVQEKVDELRPQIEQKLKETIRAELTEKMRSEIQADMEQEAETIKRQCRSKATKSVFVYKKTPQEEEEEDWLSNINFHS